MAGDKPKKRLGWVKDEIRSRTLDWAWVVVSPFVGSLAALQATLAHETVTVIWAVSIFSAAMTATLLNQAYAFWKARNINGRLVVGPVMAFFGFEQQGERTGYLVRVTLVNTASAPLEYEVTDFRVEIDERTCREDPNANKGAVIAAGMTGWHGSGIANLGKRTNAKLSGKVLMTYRYGHPNKLNYSNTFSADLGLLTDADGSVVSISSFHAKKVD